MCFMNFTRFNIKENIYSSVSEANDSKENWH